MIRIFIIQHDCGHGSFFPSRKANNFVGAICGVITFTPYKRWRKSHNIHHNTSSDLDYRGEGDLWTLTVDEYRQKSLLGRIGYRLYRNPLVMFVFGGPYVTLIRNRFPLFDKGVMLTNLAIAGLLTAVSFVVGWKTVLMVQLPIMIIATNIGVWLFYVQHQFADTYWEKHENWEFILSATDGASFYKLPRIFQWFSGNIGFHHLHHLNPRIPNYLLPEAHYSLPYMESIPVMTFWSSLKTMNKTLWDPRVQKLVSFKQAKSL
jgi:omega-6 fatty acid desaturase (delta-12 desaturase)